MFYLRDATPETEHCTNCYQPDPECDIDGYSTCCNDSVCSVNEDGSCPCTPRCEKCGQLCEAGYTFDRMNRRVHPECCDVFTAPGTETKKPAKSAQTKRTATKSTKTSEHTTKRATGSHADCEHENSKSARAKCRRQRSK